MNARAVKALVDAGFAVTQGIRVGDIDDLVNGQPDGALYAFTTSKAPNEINHGGGDQAREIRDILVGAGFTVRPVERWSVDRVVVVSCDESFRVELDPRPAPGMTVEVWYDRSAGVRSWVVQTKDAEGNQVGSCDYTHRLDQADGIAAMRRIEIADKAIEAMNAERESRRAGAVAS